MKGARKRTLELARHAVVVVVRLMVWAGACVACLMILDHAFPEILNGPAGLRPGLIAEYPLGGQVWSLAFSAGDAYLVSATIAGEVTVKDLGSGGVLPLQSGPVCSVRTLAFAAGKTILAFPGKEAAVRLYDVGSREELPSLETGAQSAGWLTFSPDGTLLAVEERFADRGRHVVSVWDWNARRRVARLEIPDGGLIVLAFAPDGTQLAIGDFSGSVTLWDTAHWLRLATVRAHAPGHRGTISLAFSPAGHVLATANSLEATVRLWDTANSRLLASLPATGHVNALGFSPDGARLAAAQADGYVSVWDHASRRQVGVVPAAGRSVYSLAFSGDGRRLATGDFAGTVRIWDFQQVLESQAAQQWSNPQAVTSGGVPAVERAGRDDVSYDRRTPRRSRAVSTCGIGRRTTARCTLRLDNFQLTTAFRERFQLTSGNSGFLGDGPVIRFFERGIPGIAPKA
jgi:WD40 repeat protein